MRRDAVFARAIWVLAGTALLGCGETKLPTLEQAKQAVTESVEEVTEQAETAVATVLPTGSIELTLDAPLKTPAAYVRVSRFSAARPTVVQIASYEDPAAEQFPSVLLRAELPAGPPASLAGQTLEAQAFAQATSGGAVWHSTAPIEIRITAEDEKSLTGEIVRGEMLNVASDVKVQLSGKFTAVKP
jgi:hypothetical protein